MTATAGHLIGGGEGIASHYTNALNDIHRELRHPLVQRKVFSLASASPKEILRARLSTNEIQHRALTYIPDDILLDVPKTNNAFSLFQGFQATLPDPADTSKRKITGRRGSRGRKAIADKDEISTPDMVKLNQDKVSMTHKLEMLTIRKNMCSTEIHEIDNKISNLNTMRKMVLDRLAGLEQEEAQLENDLLDVDTKIEDIQEEIEDAAALAKGQDTPPTATPRDESLDVVSLDSPPTDSPSFMSQSIYEKIPSPKVKRSRPTRRRSNFILHEHLQAGSQIRELQAHNDIITALDFDVPFGTMVTAALDDTVRVWDLNAGRCIGLLEGHLSSVRCLQVEDNLVATGSLDASVRLWDLSQADYTSHTSNRINKDLPGSVDDEDDDYTFADHPTPTSSSMADCEIFNLSSHVAEVTALHFHNSTLVSGSADKTLRQWDLGTGRCVQTMDVMWAAAQAAININIPAAGTNNNTNTLFGAPINDASTSASWRQPGRTPDSNADFVGAVQCFDAALACGTADGMVRLWDLRSGQVHRSLVGHTGPVTCLQFDDVHMVTGSLDRSVRVSLALQLLLSPLTYWWNCVLTFNNTDLGSPYRHNLRCLRLRQPNHQHDVRRSPHRCCRR